MRTLIMLSAQQQMTPLLEVSNCSKVFFIQTLRTMKTMKNMPIQTGTYTYNVAQVSSNYLKPLCKNYSTISDTYSFSRGLSTLPPLEEDEGNVSCDVESLFTNIPVSETAHYIIDQIYI